MADFKYQLVLQLPGHTRQDFDALVALEDAVAEALEGTPHELDGHDFGSGTGNIFIDTNDPAGAFALAKQIVRPAEHPGLKAAYRAFEEDEYTLLWPEKTDQTFELM
jgi:hypothetical protein